MWAGLFHFSDQGGFVWWFFGLFMRDIFRMVVLFWSMGIFLGGWGWVGMGGFLLNARFWL